MKHLYVHIPFCRSRCAYCDFASEPVGAHARAGRVERYLEALRAEVAERGGGVAPGLEPATGPDAEPLETVYLGGGTPTVLPQALLLALVRDLASRLDGGPASEFTIEANPGTIDAPLLEGLAHGGVTRLSLGVQSFAPALRAALGRRVAQEEIASAFAAIAATGWREWNLDLVFGTPGQTWELAAADVDAAVAAGPTHISLYDLTYTPEFEARVNGAFGARAGAQPGAQAGAPAGVTAREAAGAFAEHYYADAVARLEAAGYLRYEVSNFALPGHECRHNLAYWRGEDYLGIGAAAVSTLSVGAPVTAAERRTNPRTVADYLAGAPGEIEMLRPETRLWEKAMLGLRTSEGVDESAVLSVLDQTARDRLLAQGCLERRYGKLRLNPGFLDVSNTVIGALLVRPGWS
jgi:oxygen-independent coproporphyrinogen-3 oxidase